VYTTEELSELIRSLRDADLHRLESAGRVFALKCWREPAELLNETVLRSLDGKRRCPKTMKIVAFLYGVMRSIASEWGGCRVQGRGVVDENRWGVEAEIDVDTIADKSPGPLDALEVAERRDFGRAILKEVREMFENDEQAWFVIEADMEGGLSPDDICATLEIDRQRYHAVRKRVRRGLDDIRRRHKGGRP
jgi:hypothetical protein